MADIIRAFTEAIDKVGLLAVLIVTIIIGTAYIVHWNRQLVNSMRSLGSDTINRNTVSMNDNTSSNLKLVAAVEKLCEAFDSDMVRKTKEEVVEEIAKRFNCRAAEVEILMREQERKKASR